MSSEKWQRLMREYGRVGGELGFVSNPITVSVEDLTLKDLQRIREDAKAAKRQQELNQLFHFDYCIKSDFYGSGFFKTPVDNEFKHSEKAKTAPYYMLKEYIRGIQLEIEKTEECIEALNKAVFSDEVKKKAEHGAFDIQIKYAIGSRSSSHSIRWSQYADLAKLTREKIECLKEVVKFHRKIKRVYENELKRRTISKDEFTDTIKKAEELCKKAEKCREKVVQANEKAAKKLDKPNFETAKAFVENFDEFHILQRQHVNLKGKLKFLTDEQIEFPEFPHELTIDETSRKTTLIQTYKQEKRRLEREVLRRS